ncbi:MAG: agmatinase [Lachnospirales bacterium]
MFNKNISTFIGCDSSFEESNIVIFGAPFDSTTSFRPGTRFASKVMRLESFGIETYSPYQDKDLEDINVFDGGDLELPFGNVSTSLTDIENYTTEILNANKKPLMIGGEHLVTYGTMKAISKKYDDVYVLHFDAHCDLREDYLGEKLSHATVIRRVTEMVGSKNVFQLGLRSGTKEEFDFGKNNTNFCPLNLSKIDEYVELLMGKKVYLTVDLDVLDPSIFPGTGTPEAGGVTFNELLNALLKLKCLNIIGADINELSPSYDNSGVSTAVACKLLREILLLM